MTAEQFIREWLGTPHCYNGRSKDGVDCYGLVWLYYSHVLGVTLPSFTAADTRRAWVADFMTLQFNDLSRPCDMRDHALAFGKGRSLAHHIGVYYKGSILHTNVGGGVVFQDLATARSTFGRIEYREYVG